MTKFGVIEYLDAENGEYYITYPPFYEFNSNCDVKFNLYHCKRLLQKNNRLVEFDNSNLKKQNLNQYLKLLSYLNMICDCIHGTCCIRDLSTQPFQDTIKNNIQYFIENYLETRITAQDVKYNICSLIEDMNNVISVNITNIPITQYRNKYSSFYNKNIVTLIKVNSKYNGITKIVKELYYICKKDIDEEKFKQKVKLILCQIANYDVEESEISYFTKQE